MHKILLNRIKKSIFYGVIGGIFVYFFLLVFSMRGSGSPFNDIVDLNELVFIFVIIGIAVLIIGGLFGLFIGIICVITDKFFSSTSKIFSIFRGFISGIVIMAILIYFLPIASIDVYNSGWAWLWFIMGGFSGAIFDLVTTKLIQK